MREPIDRERVEALLAETGWIRALARSLVRDGAVAEELVQDLWVAALQRWPAAGWDLRRWARGVVRNLTRERQRSEARRTRREQKAARSEAVPSAQELAEQAMLHRRLVDAVLTLAEPYRTTVLLRFFHDMPPREMARRQGVPPETVRTRLKRAIDQLRAALDRDHGGRREAWFSVAVALGLPRPATVVAAAKVVTAAKVAAAVLLTATAVWLSVKLLGPPADPMEGRAAKNREERTRHLDVRRESSRLDAIVTRGDAGPGSSQDGRPDAAGEREPSERFDLRDTAGPATARITGVVRDPAGEPVVGAEVAAHLAMVPRRFAVLDRDYAVFRTVTDAAGRYLLRSTGEWLVVSVESPGFACVRRLHPGAGRLDFVLGRGGCLAGRVRRSTDLEPVGNATVAVCGPGATINLFSFGSNGESAVYSRRIAHGHVRTDADGRFRLPDLTPGPYELHVLAAGYPPVALTGEDVTVRAGRTTERDVLLRPGGCALLGSVIDADSGRPVADARVRSADNHRQRVRTDGDGRFRLEGLDGGPADFLVEARGFAVHRETVEPGSTGTLRHTIPIRRLGAVTGQVVDSTGHPVEAAVVSVAFAGDQTRSSSPRAISDTAGRFRLNGVRPGPERRLQAVARGHASALSSGVSIEAGETVKDVVLRMAEGRVVSGRITPPPWPPIAISLTSVDASVVVPGPTKTDATGLFEFRDVAAGRYRFTAWLGRQFHHFGAEIHVSRDAVTHAHLSLDPARTIGGRVVDEQDRPVPWAEIAIHDRESDGGATRGIVYAGPRGGFHIRDAARGGVRLTVHTQGRHPETEVEARSGDTGVIVRLSKRFPLVGRAVVSPEGTPPPSFRVCVYPGGRSWSVQSPEGRFEIPARELPDEVFEVEARDAGGRVSRRVSGLKNRTPIAQLELALREGGSIVGRLIWSDGKPAAGIAVAVQPVAAIKRIQTRTDARGRFEADGLQAGPHRLIARPEGAREAVRRVDVAAGRRSEVKWVLPRTP